MEKILGLDLGTNSIGWAIRNTLLKDDNNQIEKCGVIIFEKGVGSEKGIEYSYAAERTKNRSVRRLYQARKYRIWETLKVLIENGYCPLTMEELDQWRKYDKEKGFYRKYPIGAAKFEEWVRLDFNGDGIVDYPSPYQLRKEIAEKQLNLDNDTERFKFGRALYHMAQRRGFKSSKGENVKEQEQEIEFDVDLEDDTNIEVVEPVSLKKSEEKRAGKLFEYKEKRFHEGVTLNTLGSILSDIESQGERIRKEWTSATIRQQYQDEIYYLFKFQNQLSVDSNFYKDIHKAIFFKRPLRSQKGLVGKCTFEPAKPRCPVSHPDFEEFRAWGFINSIEFKRQNTGQPEEWVKLPVELKQKIYNKHFLRTKPNFLFGEIADFIVKETSGNYKFNYKYKTNVSGCPVSARLKNLFGENWKNYRKETHKVRKGRNDEEHSIAYNIYDVWHVLFTFEDEEYVYEFAVNELELSEKDARNLVAAWLAIPQGYGMLSLKSIKNINRFLVKGSIYSEAVLLAKLPEILGEDVWKANEEMLLNSLSGIISQNRDEKRILNITNGLIAKYKISEIKQGYKNVDYRVDDVDLKEIVEFAKDSYGEKTWMSLKDEKLLIIEKVAAKYQAFFSTSERNYYRLPRLGDSMKVFLIKKFKFLQCSNKGFLDEVKKIPCRCDVCKRIKKLYHPSLVEIYPQAKDRFVETEDKVLSLRLLESPKTGSFKNPMAMRTLHQLRDLINYLLVTGQIDEETRIVVETARGLNDSNKRWAIETYQRQRQAENKEFENAIVELLKDSEFSGNVNPANEVDIDRLRLLSEQFDISESPKTEVLKDKKKLSRVENFNKSSEFLRKVIAEKDLVKKYRLWKEQQFRCIYTGKTIKITDLFSDGIIDFEHTIPRSISFDNSLANLTVCFSEYNRNIKGNKIPAKLEDHDKILARIGLVKRVDGDKIEYDVIGSWAEKIEQIKDNIEFWLKKSRHAQVKTTKDNAIRQRHLWQMELDYWQNKVERFKMEEVSSGFKNSQLVDTQLISKYAFHYLKSVFSSVDVQKGSVTAQFRKIYSIQPKDEVKDRGKHSHHAKDAAVLTLIPVAARREEILKRAYEYAEANNNRVQYLESPYNGFKHEFIDYIEQNLLINHISKDNSLAPSRRRVRVRGRVVPLMDEQGNILFETDVNGNTLYRTDKKNELIYKVDHKGNFILDQNGDKTPIPIPKAKWAMGDSIRGQLHLDTFYGKIKVVQRDEDGKPKRDEQGNWMYVEKNDGFKFVLRKEIDKITDIKQIVSEELQKIIQRQLNGRTLEVALREGVYMLDSKGNPVGNSIRHIRCWANDVTNPISVKEQTYPSKHDYKNSYYSKNGENILYGLYWDGESDLRGYECRSLFNVAKQIKTNQDRTLESFFEPYKDLGRGKNKISTPLYAVLKPGIKVLFYKDNREELIELSNADRLKRLYKMNRIFDPNKGVLQFQYHLEARDDKALMELYTEEEFGQRGKNGFSEFNYEFPWPKLLLSLGKFNFLIEGKDFDVKPDGIINFY